MTVWCWKQKKIDIFLHQFNYTTLTFVLITEYKMNNEIKIKSVIKEEYGAKAAENFSQDSQVLKINLLVWKTQM